MTAGAIWILLTIIAELFFLSLGIFGDAASEQGKFIDDAFILLMVLAIPIFYFHGNDDRLHRNQVPSKTR